MKKIRVNYRMSKSLDDAIEKCGADAHTTLSIAEPLATALLEGVKSEGTLAAQWIMADIVSSMANLQAYWCGFITDFKEVTE